MAMRNLLVSQHCAVAAPKPFLSFQRGYGCAQRVCHHTLLRNPAVWATSRMCAVMSAAEPWHNTERIQPPLPRTLRNAKRAESQRLGKKLVEFKLGKGGITKQFLAGLGDALAGNELVKVRLVGGCMLEVDEAQEALEEGVDAITVHKIGSTITMYRQKDLPRPQSSLWQPETGGAPQPAPLVDPKAIRKENKVKTLAEQAASLEDRPPLFKSV